MTIRYAETYEIITPESAEYGEAEESGFIDECIESSFSSMGIFCREPSPAATPSTQ